MGKLPQGYKIHKKLHLEAKSTNTVGLSVSAGQAVKSRCNYHEPPEKTAVTGRAGKGEVWKAKDSYITQSLQGLAPFTNTSLGLLRALLAKVI